MLIQNEQEAVGLLLYSAIGIDGELTDHEAKKISNMLVFCSIFRGHNIQDITRKYFTYQSQYNPVDIIEASTSYISEPFKPTLFAMLCDLLCSDGNTNDTDIALLGMVANKLQIDDYLPIATTFITRYAFNYNIESVASR